MFVRRLQEEAGELFHEYIDIPEKMLPLTGEELRSFHAASNCQICNQPLGWDKVRDHCHIVGNYRVAAHSRCNLMYRISKSDWQLPVAIHNLKGYDGGLIAKVLKSEFGEVRMMINSTEHGEVSLPDCVSP